MIAGRYLLVDPVGRGGMGAVWRAYDVRRQAWVAAKVLGLPHSEAMLRFVREQAVRVRHPHVLAPTGWAAEDDTVLFTMELVRGGSVADLPRPLPEGFVAELLGQLLEALVAVHAAGVVHRDVKPANLLLHATGVRRPRLLLSDFGVATPTSPGSPGSPGLVVGTAPYASPEQEAGHPPDPRDDLHAVGMVGLLLLGGQEHAGRLGPLLGTLVGPLCARPTAAGALTELRRLGVPFQAGPPIADRLGDVAVPLEASLGLPHPRRTRAGAEVAAACCCFAGSIGLSVVAAARVLAQ